MYGLAFLFIFGAPLLGLAFGAILPVFLYGERFELALILNVAGFLIYLLPTYFFSLVMCAENIKNACGPMDHLQALTLTLGIFAAVEGITILLQRHTASKP